MSSYKNSALYLSVAMLSVSMSQTQAADAPAPCSVPLELVNVGSAHSPEYKLGIYVGLGGGAPQLYEFDTGGQGFWAAYTARPPQSKGQWWGSYDTVQKGTLSNQYTSGIDYAQANLVNTVVALYEPQGSGFVKQCESAVPVGVAQVTKFADAKKPAMVKAWNQGLKTGNPPLFGHFYGDFGAALSPILTKNQKAGVYSALPQMPQTGLTNGFIVHVGPLEGAQPTLQVGITDADLASFTTQLPMNPGCKNKGATPSTCIPYPNFPVGDMPAYSEQITNANIAWNYGGSSQSFSGIGLTIDTGAPSTTIWQDESLFVESQFLDNPKKTKVNGQKYYEGDFTSGVSVALTGNTVVQGGQNLDFQFPPTGTIPSVNAVSASVRSKSGKSKGPTWSGYMNTGLMLYTHYDVMFDLEHGTVGFRPVQ